jgi:ATP-dependent helicase STH1/SNF2
LILDANQDKDNEEVGDMNDDELNELLACHKSETAIFHKLEVKKPGVKLGIAASLFCFSFSLKSCQNIIRLNHLVSKRQKKHSRICGQRHRNVVSYNNGLNDDTWAMVRIDT